MNKSYLAKTQSQQGTAKQPTQPDPWKAKKPKPNQNIEMWIAPAVQSPFPVDLQSQTPFPASVDTNRTYPHYSRSLITRRKATDWASEAFAVTQPFRGPRCRMLWSERLGWGQLIAVSQMNSCIETRGGPRAPKPSWHQRAACAEQGRAGLSSASAWREPRPRPRPRGVPHKLFSSAKRGNSFYRKLHRGENSHRCFATSPRGSAQISTANGATRRLRKPPSVRAAGMQTVLNASASVLSSVCAPTRRASPCPIVLTPTHKFKVNQNRFSRKTGNKKKTLWYSEPVPEKQL